MLLLDGFGRIRYDNSEACDSSKYSLGAGTTAEIWQAWEKDPGPKGPYLERRRRNGAE